MSFVRASFRGFGIAFGAALIGIVGALHATTAASSEAPALSISADSEPARAVLLRIAHQAHVSIVIPEELSGFVTMSLRHATVENALAAVLDPLGDTYARRGNVYIIKVSKDAPTAPSSGTSVLPLSVITADRAITVLHPLFPRAKLQTDSRANTIIVLASPADVAGIRAVLQGIDIRNPLRITTETLPLGVVKARDVVGKLRAAFPAERFSVPNDHVILVTGTLPDITDIRTVVAGLDTISAPPSSAPTLSEAIRVNQRSPSDLSRTMATQIPGLRAAVSGSVIVLTGSPDTVARGKSLLAQIDVPLATDRIIQVYRLHAIDASSVAELLRRSFIGIELTNDTTLNALTVSGTVVQQQRVSEALAQLDAQPGSSNGTMPLGIDVDSGAEVMTLQSYIPGQSINQSTDAVASITQAMQFVAPDVHVAQLPTPGQIALIGPPASVRNARRFVSKVDVLPPLVALDTEVLEIDESVAKNLGLQMGTAVISTNYSEATPTPNADGTLPRLGRFQALTRTPIQFTAQLNLLVQNGKGRVLADPRITTVSGRTASIRAGDTISILTTSAGNAGTIATTQVQSFQTGVTLDITPSVTPDGEIMVNMHPIVNSLIGTNNGVPEISTRDTQTTVHLRDNETLVIGGLIQQSESRTTTKLPILGDLPLVGHLFRNDNIEGQSNELIIVITPHILTNEKRTGSFDFSLMPAPLPTVDPAATAAFKAALRTNTTSSVGYAAPTHTAALTPTPKPMSSATPVSDTSQISRTVRALPALQATNVFEFGFPPQTNFARPGDPVQIYFATFSPTILQRDSVARCVVVTSTNAFAVTLLVGTQTIALTQSAPGQWETAIPFSQLYADLSTSTISLQARRVDGFAASISIPVNVIGQ